MQEPPLQLQPPLHFVYSFDLKEVIPHIDIYNARTKYAAERHVAEIIYECFVVPADQDYLTARLLALHGLPRGFFWSAAQSAEKYLKAFLLMRGNGILSQSGHPIINLFKSSAEIEPNLHNIDVTPHPSITNASGSASLLQVFSTQELLQELEKHGTPNNRYNAAGIDFNTGHLLAFDSFAYQVRAQIGAPDIEESLKVFSDQLQAAFNNTNPWFSKQKCQPIKLPSESLPLQASGTVTHIEFVSKNLKIIDCKIALTWLHKKMKLTKEQILALENS
jgi:hypothetical protein